MILYVVMLIKLVFSCYFGSVVPINTTVRLPGENWTGDLLNTTSEAFRNLSKQLQIKVSVSVSFVVLRYFQTSLRSGKHVS